ncbi:hypothetical protein LY76DRAFT_579363 [Colletotrichum caudatum]|nr:hypothetical protein LY76DRAFT_579363 [Colletotrichum caudatum]
MRYSLVFLFAPVTVLALGIRPILGAGRIGRRPSGPTVARPLTGPLCCGQGVADPTNTCSGKKLNSFCCSDQRNNVGTGCDNLAKFPVGREVLAFASSDVVCDGTGFIGCA